MSQSDVRRLSDIWEARYRKFTLEESGWRGAGLLANSLIYKCKFASVRAALSEAGLGVSEVASVLDAGCGVGYFASKYINHYPNSTYLGLDLSDSLIKHLNAAEKSPRVSFQNGDIASWAGPNDGFAVIQSLEVLHLILDEEILFQTLANMAANLREGGLILITAMLPNITFAPNSYNVHFSRAVYNSIFEKIGLCVTAERPIYYWMPDGGPRSRLARRALGLFGPRLVFALDRLAFHLRIPQRVSEQPRDSEIKLITLRRKARK